MPDTPSPIHPTNPITEEEMTTTKTMQQCPYLAMVSPQGRKMLWLRETPCTCADARHTKTR